ncbi:MAG: hypothetical protein HZB33_10240 [Nitrospirae bacterium]|nr:hypothetical protein [Nitrospirota bacterium]
MSISGHTKANSPSSGLAGRLFKVKWLWLVVFMSFCGCATHSDISLRIEPPFNLGAGSGQESAQTDEVVMKIVMRNNTVEADAQWVQESYKDFMIRNLADIDETDYAKFAEYLDGGSVYVVIHPAYHVFFNERAAVSKNGGGPLDSKNVVERFLETPVSSSSARLMKAQEKSLRDFLEYMSSDRKLVILVLPKAYRDYKMYNFRNGRDEYMRYINEVTNGSASVIYTYSSQPSRGTLGEDDKKRLFKLIFATRAKAVLVGGGFVGRCLDEFYTYFQRNYSENRLWLVPEISAISPSDVSNSAADTMLNPNGTINMAEFSQNINSKFVSRHELMPRLRGIGNGRQTGSLVAEIDD